jgi:choline dehydrogenase-like flavoprotein
MDLRSGCRGGDGESRDVDRGRLRVFDVLALRVMGPTN